MTKVIGREWESRAGCRRRRLVGTEGEARGGQGGRRRNAVVRRAANGRAVDSMREHEGVRGGGVMRAGERVLGWRPRARASRSWEQTMGLVCIVG